MNPTRTSDLDFAELARRAEAARGFAPVRALRQAPRSMRRLILLLATAAGMSLATLVGLLFYGAVLGF